MKVPGLPLNSPLVPRIQREVDNGSADYELIPYRDEASTIYVEIESIRLAHDGDERNFRPFARIKGELRSISPSHRLPGAVSEITYPEGTGPAVDARYDFTDEQLIKMIQDGYYNEGYDFVDEIRGEELELDAPVEYLVSRRKDEYGLDTPVVFVDVPDRAEFQYDLDTSGYDFTEYMRVAEKELDLERVIDEPVHEFEIEHDIFAEENRELDERESSASNDRSLEGETTEFDREREQAREEFERNTPIHEDEDEVSKLYRETIADTMDASLSHEQAPQTPEPESNYLSFDDEDEYEYEGESNSVNKIDLGLASPNTGMAPTPIEDEHDVIPVSLDLSDDENDYLFADDEKTSFDDLPALDEEEIVAAPFEREEEKASDPDSDESKARIARMLAEHAAEAERRQAAHDLGVNEKDLGPDK